LETVHTRISRSSSSDW